MNPEEILKLIFIGIIPVVLIVFGILFLIKYWIYNAKQMEVLELQKQNYQASIKAATAPKPVQTGVPKIMPYKDTMALFTAYIKSTFQETYTTEVLPQLTEQGNSSVKVLAPKDTTYTEILQSITVKVSTRIPYYLKRSVFYHFGIIKGADDPLDVIDIDSVEFNQFSQFLVVQAKNQLDAKLLSLAAKAEADPNKTIGEIFKEYDELGQVDKIKNDVKNNLIQSPDGTPVSFDDVNV